MDFDLGSALILILLVLSAFFSASETAINSLSPAKVRALLDEKKLGAKALSHLKQNYHRTLIAILVGNNFVNIAASAIATVIATKEFGSAAIGIATGILTLLVLIFGEVIPKSLASAHAETFGLFIAPFLKIYTLILTPVIWVLDRFVNILLHILGTPKQVSVTDEELLAMASIGAEEGAIDKQELELIENALEFNDIPAEGVMTPRVHMDAIPESFTLEEAAEFAVNHPHSRIPVYRDSVDHIVGILSIKELLKQLHQEDDPSQITLRQIQLLTPIKVPHNHPIQALFHEFKKQRMHMAVVLDEFGGTSGVVTMEDLLEELVGDIEDEQDTAEEHIKPEKDGVFELDGRTELDEITALTGLEIDHPGYKTVGFLITHELGHLPKEGESIQIENWEFTVSKKWRNSILKVQLKKL